MCRVDEEAPSSEQEAGAERKVFRVKIHVDPPSNALKPEMTGNVKILCGPRPIWRLLTRRFWRYVRVEFWSWW